MEQLSSSFLHVGNYNLSRLFAIFTLVLRHCYINIEAVKTTYPRTGCRFALRRRVLKQIRKGWRSEIKKYMDVVG
jgi:hypothetical protein